MSSRYVRALKSHPLSTNLGSAVVAMLLGDVVAQELEIHRTTGGSDRSIGSEEEEGGGGGGGGGGGATVDLGGAVGATDQHTEKLLSFRKYGRWSPDVPAIQRDEERLLRKVTRRRTQQRVHNEEEDDDDSTSLWSLYAAVAWDEFESIDRFRLAIMAAWSGISTFYYTGLYQIYERTLPARAASPVRYVALRVGLSFAFSIPLNAAFFFYGTFAHHLADWTALIEEWRSEVPEATLRQIHNHVPFDAGMLWSEYRLKLENEFADTILASGAMWIPINVFNFSFVSPHLRPVLLTFFSTFWNCYLSLAQHREAKILEPGDES